MKRESRTDLVCGGVGRKGKIGWNWTVINMKPGWRGVAICVCGWIVTAETYAVAKRARASHVRRCSAEQTSNAKSYGPAQESAIRIPAPDGLEGR